MAGAPKDRYINNEEREVLFNQLRETLIEIDFLNKDNPEYFMLPLKRFFNRINPRLNEYNLLMGLCRQMRRIVDVAKDRKGVGANLRVRPCFMSALRCIRPALYPPCVVSALRCVRPGRVFVPIPADA